MLTASEEPDADLAQELAKKMSEGMRAVASASRGPTADEPVLAAWKGAVCLAQAAEGKCR